MKRFFLTIALFSSILLSGCQKDSADGLIDGVYTGIGNGYDGPITVEMTIVSGEITELKVISSFEDEKQAAPIFEQLIQSVLKMQDVDSVDAISGATITSNGFLNAAYDALSQAWSGSYIPRHGPRFTK